MTDHNGTGFEVAAGLTALLLIGTMALGAYLAVPRSLRQLALSQAFRLDGSYSRRRQAIERWHLLKFVAEALSGPLLVALPVLLIGFLIHQWVVPFGIAWETLAAFHWDTDVWRQQVEESARSSHSEWGRARGYDQERILALQRIVWIGWPVIALGLVLGTCGACLVATKYLQKLILEYQRSLQARCLEYRLTDLSRHHFPQDGEEEQ